MNWSFTNILFISGLVFVIGLLIAGMGWIVFRANGKPKAYHDGGSNDRLVGSATQVLIELRNEANKRGDYMTVSKIQTWLLAKNKGK
jgi:hypothetical protein